MLFKWMLFWVGLFANSIANFERVKIDSYFDNFEQVGINGYFSSFEQVRGGYFVQVKTDGSFTNCKQARAVIFGNFKQAKINGYFASR